MPLTQSSIEKPLPSNRTLGRRRPIINSRMPTNLALMMLPRSISNRTHLARLGAPGVWVAGRQVRAHGAYDGTRSIGDAGRAVGVFECRALCCVHCVLGGGVFGAAGLGGGGVVVDCRGVVVGDFGISDGAAGFRVRGVVGGVVWGKGVCCCAYYRADCSGHCCGVVVVVRAVMLDGARYACVVLLLLLRLTVIEERVRRATTNRTRLARGWYYCVKSSMAG